MDEQEMKTFKDFWPYYVREHSRPATRLLHAFGTVVSTILVAQMFITGNWLLIFAALAVGYAFAWAAHFFVEHNRPATFKHPLWSFAADYKMVALMLTGRMKREVERASSLRREADA
jgi:hypothetical protein